MLELKNFTLSWLDVIPGIARSYFDQGKVLDFGLVLFFAAAGIIALAEFILLIHFIIEAKSSWLYGRKEAYPFVGKVSLAAFVLLLMVAFLVREGNVIVPLMIFSWIWLGVVIYYLIGFMVIIIKENYEKKREIRR